MKKNYAKNTLISSIALSIALLSEAPQADAGIWSSFKTAVKKGASAAVKVAKDPRVQAGVVAVGTAAYAAVKAKKAPAEQKEAPVAEAHPQVEEQAPAAAE
ncbi:MAG: hypothetical protein J0H12_06115 [Candidatus Paracaedimonas acanthamoebae]|uniref:Uncharacterized protein n=1 Tax=Candidatus Paracaedimonas acanthamoebae TaxID=244581 RepID=A0A8J7PKH0_9PROT|nr:hypothetical protein [Candidatus Paracaedimonas acanthamoebae]